MIIKTKELLHEVDWILDSILPIEERVVKGESITKIMSVISQLRGQLLSWRDTVVVENDIKGRAELYHPLEVLSLDSIQLLYPDMPDNLAEKHFNTTSYRKFSELQRGKQWTQ